MRRLSRSVVVICLVFGAYAFAAAQVEPPHGEVYSTYDKEKDTTTVAIRRLSIAKTDPQWIEVNVEFEYPGKEQKARPVDLIFIIQILSTGDYRYPDLMTSPLIADGKSIGTLGLRNLDKRKVEDKSLETIGMRLDTSLFERWSRASTAEIQLDKTKVTFTAAHLAKFAEFAKRLNP